MIDDRDPTLQRLFAELEQDLADDSFTTRVMAKIDAQKRRAIIAWVFAGLVLIPCGVLLANSLQGFVHLTTQALTMTVIDIDEGWITLLLSPVNSVAGLLAIGLKMLRMAYKRLFS